MPICMVIASCAAHPAALEIYLDIKLYYVNIHVVKVRRSRETEERMTQRRTDQAAIHTWLVLMKAHRTLTRHATRSIEALDMCLSDFAILEALLHKGPQSVRELGRRIDLTSGSMTAAIDRLETRQLVARADHATDRRAWVIHLTPAGKALITRVFAGHQDAMEKAMSGLSQSGARDAHRSVETARHDCRGTTRHRKKE